MGLEIKDLEARSEVKGGSPRSPTPIPVSQFRQVQNGFFRSNLFIFLMGQIVTFLVGLIFFAVGWGKLSEQFTESQAWRTSADKRLERMDATGTNHARYEIQTLHSANDQMDARLKMLEEQDRIIPVLKEKIDRLEGNKR